MGNGLMRLVKFLSDQVRLVGTSLVALVMFFYESVRTIASQLMGFLRFVKVFCYSVKGSLIW